MVFCTICIWTKISGAENKRAWKVADYEFAVAATTLIAGTVAKDESKTE